MSLRNRVEPLGELEASVMDVVWAGAPVTAREVCDRLKGPKERAYTTIMTTMDRLHRKGLLTREKAGLAWRYQPTIDREGHQRALADALATRILASHGEAGLVAFIEAATDASLLDRLSALIRRHRKGGSR